MSGAVRRDGRSRRHDRAWDLIAWAGLAVATLAVLWPLGLTNRILSGVDAFTYFTPYWAYRSAQLQAGHLPLWNPDIFLGVPFLANPQAAVLYPLHWPLTWLAPAQALIWSAALHIWLAAGFTYAFARRSLVLSRTAAWLAGILFALGGFALARIENINQLNTLAWLPALLWLCDETGAAASWGHRLRWGSAFAGALALQLLAGHTQTAFVNMVALGLWAAYPLLAALVALRRRPGQRRRTPVDTARQAVTASAPPPQPEAAALRRATGRLAALVAMIPALLLAAAQLIPTLELNRLGLRAGGLPYRQTVSFSLRPQLLFQSLLPPINGGLAEAFGSEGYAEFLGYMGIAGLVLGLIGAAGLRRRRAMAETQEATEEPASRRAPGRGALILLAGAGLLLALGAYDPIYYLLWRFVPGFDLFRAPARWLAMYALGMAALAGLGLDACFRAGASPQAGRDQKVTPGAVAPGRRGQPRWRWAAGAACLIFVAGVAAFQHWPRPATWLGWLAAGVMTAIILWRGRRRPRPARAFILALVIAELWAASRALPFTLATAPAALGLRTAPAALRAAVAEQPPAGRDRFLSLSDIRFDPGDLAELRALQADRLPPDAVERFVRASKQVEVLAPNLSALFGLPALDGYDGGLLPTDAYVKLMGLFLPPERRLPDGRLREQLREIPAGRLLDLTGVRFVITDKQNDLWLDNVYYDLEQSAPLQPGLRSGWI